MWPSDPRRSVVARLWRRARRGGSGGDDAGYVTAETAVVLPVLVLFTAMLLWGLLAATAQIRCVDAARAGARSAARSEPAPVAAAAAVAAAPAGARVTVSRGGGMVRVRVTARSVGPGGLARLLSVTVGAEAAALDEAAER